MKVLIISLLVVLSVSASLVSACVVDDECPTNQCCAGTPSGTYVCLPYHKLGEQCHFMHRTPSCGCGAGLRCHYSEGTGFCQTVE